MRCEWKKVKISDVCKICYGKDHKQLLDGNVPAYGSGGIIRRVNKSIHEKKSVLIPRKGSLDNLFFVDPPFWTVDTLFWTDIDETKINPAFFFYQLKTLDLASKNVGTAVPSLTTSVLNDIEINLPSMDIQKKIAAILSALDEKIAINRAINENLQQQLFLLYENFALTSSCTNETKLSDLCAFQEGYVNPAQTHPEYFDGEVKWLRAVDINESFITETSRTLTRAGFESAKKSALLFEPSTIAISKSGTIGRLGIIADYMCGNRAVINIAPHDTNMLAFIYCFLKSKQREFPDMAVGSVQKNLYVSLLEPLSVSIPDNESLTAFNAVGASILGMIHNNCVENTDLANLRDTILPKLMSGEIDVSKIDL